MFPGCPKYLFGDGCKYQCHCDGRYGKNKDECDSNGICQHGCAPGWKNETCQDRKFLLMQCQNGPKSLIFA